MGDAKGWRAKRLRLDVSKVNILIHGNFRYDIQRHYSSSPGHQSAKEGNSSRFRKGISNGLITQSIGNGPFASCR